MKRAFLLSLFAASLCAAETPVHAPELLSAAEIQKRAAAFKFEKGRMGGTLHDWIDEDMKTWNLALATDVQSFSVLGGNVFQQLFRRDPVTLEWRPCLAAEVPSRSEDEEGRVWLVKLRPGVSWQDGKPFGADDVVFTFNDIVLNESLPCPSRSALQMAVKDEESGTVVKKSVSVEKVDDRTVRFTFPQRYALYLQVISGPHLFPKHILKPHVEDGTFASTWDLATPPAEVIGTGPFMLAEREEGKKVVLKRNPHYWEKDESGESLPYLENWEFTVAESHDSLATLFRDGKLDYLELRSGDVDLLVKGLSEGKSRVVSLGPRPNWSYLTFNQNPRSRPGGKPYVPPHKSAWFRDVRFRRAVAYSIDRDRIVREIFAGATVLWGPCTPKFQEYYTEDVAKYPFDLAKAGALLDDMGLKDTDGDAIRDDGKGHPVEFKLTVVAGQPALESLANLLAKDLKKAGISLVPDYVPFNRILRTISQEWDWEALTLSYTAGPEPLLGKTIWKSGEARRVWNPNADPAGAETRDWERRLDDLFDEAYTHWDTKTHSFDRSKDIELAHEWQRICAENLPHIYLFSGDSVYAFSCRLGNVRTSLNSLFDPERLFIRE